MSVHTLNHFPGLDCWYSSFPVVAQQDYSVLFQTDVMQELKKSQTWCIIQCQYAQLKCSVEVNIKSVK